MNPIRHKTLLSKKNLKETLQSSQSTDRLSSVKSTKRAFLKWIPPIVVAVTLPVHAGTSPVTEPSPLAMCPTKLIISALGRSICGGDPPFGRGAIKILTDSTYVTIISITQNAPESYAIHLPKLPAPISTTKQRGIIWGGPALDLQNCFPLSAITVNVNYTCEGYSETTQSFNLTEILAETNP